MKDEILLLTPVFFESQTKNQNVICEQIFKILLIKERLTNQFCYGKHFFYTYPHPLA